MRKNSKGLSERWKDITLRCKVRTLPAVDVETAFQIGRYDYIDNSVLEIEKEDAKRGALIPSGVQSDITIVALRPETATVVEFLDLCNIIGFKQGRLGHLLSLGAADPEFFEEKSVAAYGSFIEISGGLMIPVMGRGQNWQHLALYVEPQRWDEILEDYWILISSAPGLAHY